MTTHPIRVLLVDDNPEFQEAASQFVAMEPLVNIIGQAFTGFQAIEMVVDLDPDLVLMDYVMPDINGDEATRMIKARGERPRVVILTLHDIPEYRQQAREAGADGFLAKADFGKDLLPLVADLFAGSMET